MSTVTTHQEQRQRLRVNGIVQGVGFRPFVYRLARQLHLGGFINNDAQGVLIEIQGETAALCTFVERLSAEHPAGARIDSCHISTIDLADDATFVIGASHHGSVAATLISPDLAVCEDCLRELFDPGDRRFRYPFINCTHCGPRYTIIDAIPYDRPNTSMHRFTMCADCKREYNDPENRRFHAQPVACPVCGPELALHNSRPDTDHPDLVLRTVELLRTGKILAIRGLGGFHLAVDAANDEAVAELRRRKGRAEKPLAMMVPDIDTIRRHATVSGDEAALLESTQRPIVLLRRRPEITGIADAVAFTHQYFGFMLPYTPLHYLIMRDFGAPLVMTSGNITEEPIAIGNVEAMERLKDLADYFLLHNRDIRQRCDDSIARVALGRPRMIRRARSYVPDPLYIDPAVTGPLLAVGGELKNTVALAREERVFMSQHVGDLDNPAALGFFEECIQHMQRVLEIEPQAIVCDMHPEYLSTKWAHRQTDLPVIEVQHHHAHLASVLAEHKVTEPAIGLILDGTGYGTDGTIWGGEVLVGDANSFERFAWLQPVHLPGGSAAIRQPWRMGASYLRYACGGDAARRMPGRDPAELDTLFGAMDKGINSPLTSSCGRLFDGMAALLGLCQENKYEAQAAMALEMAAMRATGRPTPWPLPDELIFQEALPFDWLIRACIRRRDRGDSVSEIAQGFHATLAEVFIETAQRARDTFKLNHVALSGGVYQNTLFLEYLVRRLEAASFQVWIHERVPTNDGGLALGQVVVANAKLQRDTWEP
jgi:hydrogenase maturation protein HypF